MLSWEVSHHTSVNTSVVCEPSCTSGVLAATDMSYGLAGSFISSSLWSCRAHADPEVTDKVFFDLTVGGKPAGLHHLHCAPLHICDIEFLVWPTSARCLL